MSKVTFDHIHLRSSNSEATAVFYAAMFGVEIICSAPAGKLRIGLTQWLVI